MNRIQRYLQPSNLGHTESYLAGVEDGRRLERQEWEQRWLADTERLYWVGVKDGIWLARAAWIVLGAVVGWVMGGWW